MIKGGAEDGQMPDVWVEFDFVWPLAIEMQVAALYIQSAWRKSRKLKAYKITRTHSNY